MSEPRAISLTIDLEDIRPQPELPPRHVEITDQILERFSNLGIRATFFVVGELARENPTLIKRISERGHEIGLHSLTHTPLPKLTAAAFISETRIGRDVLNDIIGGPVAGYRAPIFSLTRATPWVPDQLAELGFRYSSSVLPAGNPLYGFPGAPSTPFRWDCGLIELPAPVTAVGPLRLPVMGGIYFRYLPLRTVRRAARTMTGESLAWSYLHPYDFDDTQPFFRMRNTGLPVSLLLWLKRRGTWSKLERFLATPELQAGQPLSDRIAEISPDHLPVFTPWTHGSHDGA